MLSAPARVNEAASLAALRALQVLDTGPELAFDALVQVASSVCGVPISLISLIDAERQWFKANVGLPGVTETPREFAFCAHAVLGDEVFEVSNACADQRFADNPLVAGPPDIRFYAGAPIRLSNGVCVGTLCVIDREVRHLDEQQRGVLRQLAAAAAQALEGRQALLAMKAATEQAQASARVLAEERLRLAHLISSTDAGTWEWQIETGAVRINERWAEIVGYTHAELEPLSIQTWLDRIHPEDLEPTRARLLAHLQGAAPRYDSEYRIQHRDGHWVWVADHGCVMTWTANGRADWMFGTHTDISRRMEARVALQDAKDRMALATDSGGIGIWDFDLRNGTLVWDDWMYRLYGLPAGTEPPTYERWMETVHPDDRGVMEQAVQDALHASHPVDAEYRAIRPDGEVRYLRASARVKRDEKGRAARIVGANWDVSEARRQAQAIAEQHASYVANQQRLDRMKSEFLSLAAHELRTPMTSIFGFTELLTTRELPAEKQRQILGRIHRQSQLMINILDELLDLTKIESRGAVDFDFVALDLNALVTEVLQDFNPPEGREAPEWRAAPAAAWVRADRHKMQQALLNILVNAYKYSPEGGAVQVSLLAGPGDGSVGVAVQDHGMGLSPENLARMGERFFRADTSGHIPGTGLGVSIVKEVLDLMGGRFQVESTLGQGTCITLWVPETAAPV